MSETFNLTVDPWVPLRGVRGGPRVEASLRDALTGAHEWAGYPDDDGQFGPAILRLLVVLAYQTTALGEARDEQEFEDALEETWALGQFDAQRVDRYLQEWRDEFWLFPPEGFTGRRWMQDRRLEELPTTGITASGLQPQASPSHAWGNQAVEPLSAPAAARALLAFMHYGRGGGGAKHPDGGPPRWQDGRLRGRVSIHPIGRTLFDTLMLNTIPPDDGALDRIGRPEWETGQPEATSPIGVPTSVLEQLSGRWEKAAWLHQARDGTVAEVCITAARRRPDEVAEADPYTILNLVERREGKQLIPVPLRSTPGKAVWRDFPSLKAQSETARHETHILRSLQQFGRRAARQKVASWAIAAHRRVRRKPAADSGWDISFISPTALLHPATEDAISLFVDIAEGSAEKLVSEIRFFLSEAGYNRDPQEARVRRVEGLFWSAMEAEFRQVVARPDDRAAMQSAVVDAALRAYDAAVDVSTGAAADYRGHKDKQPVILPVAVSRQRHRHRLISAIRKLCDEKEQHDRAQQAF